MRLLALTVAALLATSLGAAPAFGAGGGTSYTWVGSSQDPSADNHSWTDARNWNPTGVPADGDSVSITEPDAVHCTAHVDHVPTIALVSFSLASTRCSSSITGGALTVTGSFAWDGGSIFTPTTIAAGATGTLSGTNGHLNALSAELDVAGTLTLSGVADSGAANSGGFRIVNPYVLHVRPGGTLSSVGANAVQYLSCCVNPAKIVNDGTLDVSSGDLLVRAVEVDQNGSLAASAGGRLVTLGAPITAGDGASYSGSGGWRIAAGAKARLSGTQTVGSGFHLELGGLDVDAGAELGGTATLAGAGVLDWTGGTIEGNLTIATGMTVHASGGHTGNGKRFLSGDDSLSAHAASILVNHGRFTVDQQAAVLTGNQARLVNAADGTLTLAPGTQFTTLSCCVNPSRITNAGRLTVPAGTSTQPVALTGVAFQSTGGTTSVAAGRTLQVSLAPSALTSATVAGGGTLALAAHTAVRGAITVGTGTRLNLRTGGSLDGPASIGGPGALAWTGGALSGNLSVATGGGVTISGPDSKSITQPRGGSTTSMVTFRARTTIAAGTSAAHDRIDLGSSTLTLASATNVGNFVDVASGTLLNRGTLTVGSGTFRVAAYAQMAGRTTVVAGARLALPSVSRSISLVGGVLAGAGTVAGGVVNSGGTVAPGGAGTGRLTISGGYTQGARGTLALDLAARTRDLLAVSGAVSLRGRLTARNLGSYRPRTGVKYRLLAGIRLAYALSCATTSGTASSTGHWAPGHTSTGLYLVWRAGAHRHC